MAPTLYYTPDPSLNETDAFLNRFLKHCNDRAKARIEAAGLDETYFVETYLTDDATLNAYAGIEGGINVIEINRGAMFLLRDLFDQMLSHPRNFPNVGTARNERIRSDYNLKRQTIDLSTVVERHWQPIDLVRARYASDLAIAALEYLFEHELGHIFNGHIALIKDSGGPNRVPELGASSISGLTALDRQTLEFDADCFAIGASMLPLGATADPATQRLYKLFCAVYLLHKAFSIDVNVRSVGEVLLLGQLPAHLRLRLVLGSSVEVMWHHRQLTMPDFGRLIVKAMLDCEEGFARLSGELVDPDKLLHDGGLTEPLASALLSNWKVLRPRLLPFSFDGRLNP